MSSINLDPALLARLPRQFNHLGFVWRDIEAAITRFERLLGVRFAAPNPGSAFPVNRPHGEEMLHMRTVHAQFGPIKLEFIQPLSGPSIYQEHLDAHGEGLHHVGFVVQQVEQYIQQYRELGIAPVMFGVVQANGESTGFAYFDTYKELGVLTEVVDLARLSGNGWSC